MPVLEKVERRCARAVLSVIPRSLAASCRLRPLARQSASCASLWVSSKSLRMVSTGGGLWEFSSTLMNTATAGDTLNSSASTEPAAGRIMTP